ncbi:hypothetical protein FOZ60_011204 [Perkinsus olseni]|uniref:Uncharacterized protein n=1 Tax=Perkinsus olseni TaxID=32597 RepID=A0A7J6NDX4_PEROL|nr:hypothetical protein FOZ60_011204 [Perkinsus olseni]
MIEVPPGPPKEERLTASTSKLTLLVKAQLEALRAKEVTKRIDPAAVAEMRRRCYIFDRTVDDMKQITRRIRYPDGKRMVRRTEFDDDHTDAQTRELRGRHLSRNKLIYYKTSCMPFELAMSLPVLGQTPRWKCRADPSRTHSREQGDRVEKPSMKNRPTFAIDLSLYAPEVRAVLARSRHRRDRRHHRDVLRRYQELQRKPSGTADTSRFNAFPCAALS